MASCRKCDDLGILSEQLERKINSMIKEKWLIIMIALFLIVFAFLLGIYFARQLIVVIHRWKKNKSRFKAPDQDTEIYDEDLEDEMAKPELYFDEGKQDFVKKVQKEYKKYNIEKTEYIATNYNKETNDIIDQNILYSKYDNNEK